MAMKIPIRTAIKLEVKEGTQMEVKAWEKNGRLYIKNKGYDYIGIIELKWFGREVYLLIPLKAEEIALELTK